LVFGDKCKVLRDEWQDGKENGKGKMAKGTGSGKARIRTRLFGDIKKHKAVIEFYKGKCISITRYEIKNSKVDRYLGTVEFEHRYADIINSVISNIIMPYGAKYDVFLKTAKDRRYVMACVSTNCDYEDIGIKNCFNLCRKLIDLIMRQIEHDEKNSDDLDLDSMISDRMDEIKTNIGTFVKFEISNTYQHEDKRDDESLDDIRKKVIDELISELKSLKKKFG
jgi:hypothetical protein